MLLYDYLIMIVFLNYMLLYDYLIMIVFNYMIII